MVSRQMAPIAYPAILPPQPSKSAKAIKPLLRRATLSGTVRKRDDADIDMEDDTRSSPSKRVKFNPLVEEKMFTDSPPMSSADTEDIRFEVRRALEDHLKGSSEAAYDALRELFGGQPTGDTEDRQPPSGSNIKEHLLALTGCVSLLGKSCSSLVNAVLMSEWVGRDEGFVKAFVQFLGNLASAQGAYVGRILESLVGKFLRIRASSGRLRDYPIVHRPQLMSRVHMAIKYLLRLIPSASGTLAPILSSKFPFSDDNKKMHADYVNNLIQITEYAPELKAEIFALITERLIKIDAQMQTDLDEIDEEVVAGIAQSVSLAPGQIQDGAEDDDSEGDSTTSDEDEEESRIKAIQDNAAKLDSMMDTLFTVYAPYFNEPESLEAEAMFDTLLSHFRNIILPTYRSRHTQFLLFHFAQRSDHLIDQFTGECLAMAFNSGLPAVLKQSAAAYLGSFVSRGARVGQEVVRTVFQVIGNHLEIMRKQVEPTCRGPDLQRYGTFYACTQALLYIFCFRWRDLIDWPETVDDDEILQGREIQWCEGVKASLDLIINSKLNPLKVCAPDIVREFSTIANHLGFMYVFDILQVNKRVRLSQFALAGSSGSIRESGFGLSGDMADEGMEEKWHQLDTYFPFDPYQLPLSRKWVDDDYLIWRDVPGMKRPEDTEREDDDSSDGGVDLDDEDDEDVDLDTTTDDES